MIIDKILPILAGVTFVGMGIRLRQRQNPKWRVFLFSGILLLVIVGLALIFGWSLV
jgi:hypothetical protein